MIIQKKSILFQNKPNVTSSISYDNLALRPDDDNYRAFDDTVVLKYRHLHYFDNL